MVHGCLMIEDDVHRLVAQQLPQDKT